MPFSIFPSSYKETAPQPTQTTTTHQELEIKIPEKAGREGQYSLQASADLPPREPRVRQEEVRITREEEHYRRPGVREEYFRKEHRLVRWKK